MPTNTNIPLASYTVSGSNLNGPTGVTFSLPAASVGYTDIVIRANIKTTAAAIILGRFNGDTGSNYTSLQMGNGPASGNGTSSTAMYFSAYAHGTTNWGSHTYNIMNYANSTTRKTILMRGGNSTYGVDQIAGSWNTTPTPITSVTIFLDRAENFVVGSTFTVYGIASAPLSPKATGGAIYSDAEYFYHVFGATGTFTPLQSLTCDTLIVAGGGGGGARVGGGGGAGGYRLLTGVSATATPYTITVGAGGAGQIYSGANATSGGNSTAIGNSATGGGYGGMYAGSYSGAGGGSGGGANGNTTTSGSSGNAGSYTPVEGYAGGNSTFVPSAGAGGGGGGAGGAGTAGQAYVAGTGGAAIAVNPVWLAATGVGYAGYIAGGGGGGTESNCILGLGGGGGAGIGSNSAAVATSGIANTGSGGGGGGCCSSNQNGGNGGSGVVIVRYLK